MTLESTAAGLYDVDRSMRIKLIGFRQNGVRPQYAHIPEADPEHLAKLSDIIRGVGIEDLVLV